MGSYKWCDIPHSRFILKNFYDMQQLNYKCDVTLVAENEKIQAHKLVLCAVSPFFRAMESAGMKESQKNEIVFQEISGPILHSIIKFIYTSEIEINETNAYDLMAASHMLQISILKLPIAHYLLSNLNPNNCLKALSYAKLYGYEETAAEILTFTEKNFHFVITKQKFEIAPPDIVELVLCHYSLNLYQICHALGKWINYNIENATEFVLDRSRTLGEYIKYLNEIQENNKDLSNFFQTIKRYILERFEDKLTWIGRTNGLVENQVLLSLGGTSASNIWANVEGYTEGDWSMCLSGPGVSAGGGEENLVLARMLRPRMCFGAVATVGRDGRGCVYVVGGSGGGLTLAECERYDAAANTWTELHPLPMALRRAAVTAVENVPVVTGGADAEGRPRNETWEYHSKEDRWARLAPMLQARSSHGSCSVRGTLYVMGGCGAADTILCTVERYNSDLDAWSNVRDMPESKSEFGCVAIGEHIYVIGGASKSFILNSVHRYNTLSDTWERCADMPAPKSGFGCSLCAGRVHCVGGRDLVHGPLTSGEAYNPRTDRWHYLQAQLMTPRCYSAAVTLNLPAPAPAQYVLT